MLNDWYNKKIGIPERMEANILLEKHGATHLIKAKPWQKGGETSQKEETTGSGQGNHRYLTGLLDQAPKPQKSLPANLPEAKSRSRNEAAKIVGHGVNGKNQKYITSADRQLAEWNEPIEGKEFGNTSVDKQLAEYRKSLENGDDPKYQTSADAELAKIRNRYPKTLNFHVELNCYLNCFGALLIDFRRVFFKRIFFCL